MTIRKLDFVGVPSTDQERSRAFYVDTLGLRADGERGVQLLGETLETGVCHMAFFEDPDGNVLVLHHRYAPHE